MADPAPSDGRSRIELKDGWRFTKGAPDGAQSPAFDDRHWQSVSLPHSWNRMGGTAERTAAYDNYHGLAFYRTRVRLDAAHRDARAWIEFDAASIVAKIWVNGQMVGTHAGAFARFRFDITSAVCWGADNLIAVEVDNSKADAPGSATASIIPMSGDFPMYGGLYRPARIIVTRPTHIALDDFGGPGLYALRQRIEPNRATVDLMARISNDGPASERVTARLSVLDHEGKTVASRTSDMVVPRQGSMLTRRLSIARPHLWNGKADPYLYRMRLALYGRDGRLIDAVDQPLGLRSITIDPARGFQLNGKRMDLHGVARHQDRFAKGWAIDEADIAEDYRLIDDIGANSVRLAHYQHADYAYSLADRMGLIAWAELPLVDRASEWGRQTPSDAFVTNAEQQLRELVRQTMNHPSIAVWSIGNEVNLAAAQGKGRSSPGALLRHLDAVARDEDPTRPTTLADCCGALPANRGPDVEPVVGLARTTGLNRYFGWYYGAPEELAHELDQLRALYPGQAFAISEYGAGGAISQHSDDPRGGPIAIFGRPHPEEFQADLLERTWAQIANRHDLWASWVWAMFDFSNEERQEGDLTDTNDKGLVTFDRTTRKDAFYLFKANWSDAPFAHLNGARAVMRAYPVASVSAYSNALALDLWRNDELVGSAPCQLGICRWPEVRLAPGANRLAVKGRSKNGTPVGDTITWYGPTAPGWRIRAGTLAGAMDQIGRQWGSDVFVSGGQGHFRDAPPSGRGKSPAPTRPVVGTPDQTAYQAWREGRFAYSIPTGNGCFSVTLHVFEPVMDRRPGERVFNVAAEGATILSQVDVRKQADGAWTALRRQFVVDVRDGRLDLSFIPVSSEPLVSALEILPCEKERDDPCNDRRGDRYTHVNWQQDGRVASDHFPVVADLADARCAQKGK